MHAQSDCLGSGRAEGTRLLKALWRDTRLPKDAPAWTTQSDKTSASRRDSCQVPLTPQLGGGAVLDGATFRAFAATRTNSKQQQQRQTAYYLFLVAELAVTVPRATPETPRKCVCVSVCVGVCVCVCVRGALLLHVRSHSCASDGYGQAIARSDAKTT